MHGTIDPDDYLNVGKYIIPKSMKHSIQHPPVTKPQAPENDVSKFLKNCYLLKPAELKLRELYWKFAIRSVLRGENLLLRGDSGCGKTMIATIIPVALKRPFEIFNLGATQDPRSTLIGNTHFRAGEGTFVAEALFVKCIQTPNMVIVLDELSRAHPEAHNILMSVVDPRQRYLRIDENPNTPTIKVAEGVSFIATANVGTEYTATRTMDRALLDRFSTLIIPFINKMDEIDLLADLYPSLRGDLIASISDIAEATRKEVVSEMQRINTAISTRMTVKLAGLLNDGFTLLEAAEICIYPFYSTSGGPESEQTFIKQLIQEHLPPELKKKVDPFHFNT